MTDTDDISCEEFVELVTDYLEGAMDDPTRHRFEEHLALCEGCEVYLAQMRETARLLGRIPADTISHAARDRLLTAFRDWKRVS